MKTKNECIIEMFDSKSWQRGSKIFTSADFRKFDLSPLNDPIFAKNVISEMGFTASIGMGLYVEKPDTITMKDLQDIDHAKGI